MAFQFNKIMEKEIWKDIPDYEGIYQVSNLGRVKSLERYVNHSNGGLRKVKSKILKLNICPHGYYQFGIHKEHKSKTFKVHKAVAMAFLNHKPCGFNLVIDHIDNNKLNNKLSNIQIVTHRYNSTKDLKNNTSKYVGVNWSKYHKKWLSRITINKKLIYLGIYKNEIDAAKAYQDKLKEI